MAVIKENITVIKVMNAIAVQQQCDRRFQSIVIESRSTADDLIIALMLARDTLWPISTQGATDGE